jgi:hypothetical protein
VLTRWIKTEVCDTPKFDGIAEVSSFVNEFELHIPEQKRLLALDISLRANPVKWWETHNEGIYDWKHCKRLMQIKFGIEDIMHKYTGMSDLNYHVVRCILLGGNC